MTCLPSTQERDICPDRGTKYMAKIYVPSPNQTIKLTPKFPITPASSIPHFRSVACPFRNAFSTTNHTLLAYLGAR